MDEPIPRLFRVPSPAGPRLVLQHGARHVDLTARLGPRASDLPELFSSGLLERPRLSDLLGEQGLPEVEPPEEVLTPLPWRAVGKILALGKNFRAHAEEFGEQVPEEGLFFCKLPETLVAHGASVRVPPWYGGRVDHEAELAVVIGREGRDLAPESALAFVAGYTVANDLTARTLQAEDRKRKHPWLRSKNLDGFCPLGPCLVPRDFLDLAVARVRARVARAAAPDAWETRQDASLGDLVIDVPNALAWLSRHLTLRAGDVVLMGTPAGVGPLEDGDTVVCEVDGIGALATRILRPAAGD